MSSLWVKVEPSSILNLSISTIIVACSFIVSFLFAVSTYHLKALLGLNYLNKCMNAVMVTASKVVIAMYEVLEFAGCNVNIIAYSL